MDAQVAEKCFPGLSNLLDHGEETERGSFALQTNQSEVCLRQVFSHCTYDSRYRIKTKIKKIIGINLDLDFEDEFEVDCCDEEIMQALIGNVKDCFEKTRDTEKKEAVDKSKNSSSVIVKIAGQCIEDHTTFMCVLQNQSLFRNTAKTFVDLLKGQALEILEETQPQDYNYTRLCLKMINYYRLENCEPYFYDYVNCLKNGTNNPTLFKNLHDCFQESLKACPVSTVSTFIQIISGAMEGRAGIEPESPIKSFKADYGLEMPTTLPSIMDACNSTLLDSWVKYTKKCYEVKFSDLSPSEKTVQKVFDILCGCAAKLKPKECSFHIFSEFKKVITMFNDVVKEITPGANLKGNETKCLSDIDNAKTKDCIIKLFLYFATIHHAHHTKESVESQLGKVKLCYELALKSCNFPMVGRLLVLYGTIFKMYIPPLEESQILTKVTIPEGYIWCETKIITKEVPVPPTVAEKLTPKQVEVFGHQTPTSTETTALIVTPHRITKNCTRPPTTQLKITPTVPVFEERRTPTTVIPMRIPPMTTFFTKLFPPPSTSIVTRQPPTIKRPEVVTRTTVEEWSAWPETKSVRTEVTLPTTTVRTIRPSFDVFSGETITPTTVKTEIVGILTKELSTQESLPTTKIALRFPTPKPWSERVTRTTIVEKKVTPRTASKERLKHFTTAIEIIRPTVETETAVQTRTTTEEEIITIPPARYTRIPWSPTTEIYYITPPGTTFIDHETRSTVVAFAIPPLKGTTRIKCLNGTTMKIEILEEEEKGSVYTRIYPPKTPVFTPSVYIFTDKIPPTTTESYEVPFEAITEKTEKEVPKPTVFTYIPKTTEEGEMKTATSTKVFVYTLPGRVVTATIPEEETQTERQTPQKPLHFEKQTPTVPTTVPTTTTTTPVETTIKFKIVEGEEETFEEYVTVRTLPYIYSPGVVTYSELASTGTSRKAEITPEIKTEEKVRVTPPTQIGIRIHEIPTERTEHRSPSTTETIALTQSSGQLIWIITQPATKKEEFFPTYPTETGRITPTTHRTGKIVPTTKIYTEEGEGTTIIIDREEVMTDYIHKTGKPLTTIQIALTDVDYVTEWITPTSTAETRIVPPEKTVTETGEQLKTSIFTRPPQPHYTEIVTPTTKKLIIFSVPPEVHKGTLNAINFRRITVQPKAGSTAETLIMPPTVTFEFTEHPYERSETEKQTTMKIYINEKEETPASKGTPKRIPWTFTPSVGVFTETIPSGTAIREHITPETTIVTFARPTATTKEKIGTRPTPTYIQTQTKTSTKEVFQPLKRVTEFKTQPVPGIITRIIPPATLPPERITRTTITSPVYTAPTKFETQAERGTTLQLIIEEVPGQEKTGAVSEFTETGVYRQPTIVYTEKARPTQIIIRQKTIPGMEFTEEEVEGTTKIYEWKPDVVKQVEKETPTTVQEYTATIPPGYTRRLTPPKTIVQFHAPPTREYSESETPTTIRKMIFIPTLRTETEIETFPTTRKQLHPLPTVTGLQEQPTESTIIVRQTQPAKGYTCYYPAQTTVACTVLKRKRPPCTPEMFQRWVSRLKDCVEGMVYEEGIEFESFFENSAMIPKLEDLVKICVSKIGDTHCRNKTFNLVKWVLEKDIVVVGGYGEHSSNHSDISDHIPYRTKKCVTLTSKSDLENCFPGLHQVLMDIIILGKRTSAVQILNNQPTDCLVSAFQHCNALDRRKIEVILENTLGVCIRITKAGEESGCLKGVKLRSKKDCNIKFDMDVMLGDFIKCILDQVVKNSQKSEAYTVEEIFRVGSKCNVSIFIDCDIVTWKAFEPIFNIFVQFIKNQTAKSDKCAKQISSNEFKECAQSLITIVQRLDEVDDEKKLLQSSLKCFLRALRDCPDSVASEILSNIVFITKSKQVLLEAPPIQEMLTTIASFKVSEDSIDVCENLYRLNAEPVFPRPEYKSECIPVYTDKEQENKMYILVKPCLEADVDKWLETIKECMEKKATILGLRNPDYLTTDRTFTILEDCITTTRPIHCVPKYQGDFRKLIKSLLDMVKHNTLNSVKDCCLDTLKLETLYTCMNLLHKYLALTYDPEQFEKNKEKATTCASKAMTSCSKKITSKMIDTFDLAIVKGTKSLEIYGRESFEECSPRDYKVSFANAPSYMTCGPGGILVPIKKRYRRSRVERSEDDITDMKLKDTSELPSRKECNSEDYSNYFKRMLKCRQRRFFLKYRSNEERCYMNHIIETWSAMIECMIEKDENELHCNVTTEDQMSEFLTHASKAMSKHRQQLGKNCSYTKWCIGNHSPPLSRCSNTFYQLVQSVNKGDDLTLKNSEINKELLTCLNSVWPNCSLEISIISLPILYIPFALKYVPAVTEGFELTFCNKSDFEVNIQEKAHCLNHNGNETEDKDVLRGPKSCMTCIKSKKGFCWFKDKIEMLEITEPEFSLVSRCLKNKISGECIEYVIENVKKKCLPLFYECSDNVKRGMVLDIIERCWIFKECLEAVPKICPENFQDVVKDIYFRILGLNSVPQGQENFHWGKIFASSTTKSPLNT